MNLLTAVVFWVPQVATFRVVGDAVVGAALHVWSKCSLYKKQLFWREVFFIPILTFTNKTQGRNSLSKFTTFHPIFQLPHSAMVGIHNLSCNNLKFGNFSNKIQFCSTISNFQLSLWVIDRSSTSDNYPAKRSMLQHIGVLHKKFLNFMNIVDSASGTYPKTNVEMGHTYIFSGLKKVSTVVIC